MTRKPNTSRDQMPIYPDGLCRIYSKDEDDVETNIITNLPIRNMALGYGRVFAAKSENVSINRVIRVSSCSGFDTHDYLEITSEGKFEIMLISTKYDCIPSEIELSLRQLELHTS